MSTTKKKYGIYLTGENIEYLESQKSINDITYSDTVNKALQCLRDGKVQQRAEDLVRPTESKLDLLQQDHRYMISALNAIYRTNNYLTQLVNGGIPVIRINGNDVVKPNTSIKNLARKKAMGDYSKLLSDLSFREDFLEDYHEFDTNETDGAPYDFTVRAPFEDGGAPNRKDNDSRDNRIHFR